MPKVTVDGIVSQVSRGATVMRLCVLLLAAVLSGAVASSLAAAQSQAPWADTLPPKTPTSMRLTLDRYRYFIDCEATSAWKVIAPLFDTRIGSREEARMLKNISGGDYGNSCTYALVMSMSSMLMRGGIAEARYRFLTRNGPPLPIRSLEIAAVPEGATFRWVEFFKESPAWRQLSFATCLAEREPGLVHAVLVTRMATNEERQAMQRLSRRFGACMRAGDQLKANVLTLRPWLGEAAFQRLRKDRPDA